MRRRLTLLGQYPWLTLTALGIAALAAVPILAVFASLTDFSTLDTWAHLASTVLPDYMLNTVILCVGVGLGVSSIGVTTAWLTVMHDFPGRRFFEWALILPLAVPAYVMAYVYTDFLQFVGPLQSLLREWFGWQYGDYWFPDVRTVGGAVGMFAFVFYPYVYMLARTAFLERATGAMEAGRSLGLGPWACFFRVSLPMARPAIVAGTALALMETLADFGTVSYFGVQTFTTGIYRAWFSLGDRAAAAQLSAALLSVVVLVLILEHISRGRARFNDTSRQQCPPLGRKLSPLAGAIASIACFLPLLFGFLLPAGLLLEMAVTEGDAHFGPRFFTLAGNSFMLASVTERTREIGIRRAVGATRHDIIMQFLVETGVLSAIGGMLGVVLGVGGSLLVGWIVPLLPEAPIIGTYFSADTDLPIQVTGWSIGVAFCVATLTGLAFGLYPAMQASKQDPIVALRHD